MGEPEGQVGEGAQERDAVVVADRGAVGHADDEVAFPAVPGDRAVANFRRRWLISVSGSMNRMAR
ncbi:hypothetical protein ACWDG9_41130 [Streptomyces sp. NPDC001073]|uniref:hypothetical protein n=1 Tax=Streptomyces sp. NPDC001642 TaxID=3154392 RepID=UPI00331B1A61